MNRPAPLVRLAGSPVGATLLFVMYGAVVLGWYEGHTAWWLALGAAGAAFRTLGAMGDVRRYKAWLADWQAIGGVGQAAPRQPGRKPQGKTVPWVKWSIVALLSVGIPLALPSVPHDWGEGLTMLWFVVLVYLLWKLLAMVLSVFRRKSETAVEAGGKSAKDADMVQWLLPRASSSPSRADALQRLPEYSGRLIGPG